MSIYIKQSKRAHQNVNLTKMMERMEIRSVEDMTLPNIVIHVVLAIIIPEIVRKRRPAIKMRQLSKIRWEAVLIIVKSLNDGEERKM